MIFRTIHNNKYVTKLPKDTVRVRNKLGVELLRLKSGKRKWTTDNVEPRKGLPLLIYSPYTEWYWYRTLQPDHDMAKYRKYIKDGNLYIPFDEYWKGVVSEEREAEGMGYYDYNEIRGLILLQEHLVKQNPPGIKTKLRSIDINIQTIRKKYESKD